MSVSLTSSAHSLTKTSSAIGGTSNRTLIFNGYWPTSIGNGDYIELQYTAGWLTRVTGSGGSILLGDDNGGTNNLFTTAIVVNTWYNVAITYDGTNTRCYVNGALVNTAAWNSAGAPAGSAWAFFGNATSGIILQDALLYNAQLSTAEIERQAVQRQPLRTQNLVAFYPFFPGSNRVVDYSGNANNLTAGGTPADGTLDKPVSWGTASPRLFVAASGTPISATGSQLQSGSVDVGASKSAAAVGSQLVSGSVAVSVLKAIDAAGGSLGSGSVNAGLSKALDAAGSAVSSGTVNVTGGSSGGGSLGGAGVSQRQRFVPAIGRRRVR